MNNSDFIISVTDMASAPVVTTKPAAIQMDESFNLGVRSDNIIITDRDDKEIIFNILIADALI